jgi:Fe-S cluster assembly protein SufD
MSAQPSEPVARYRAAFESIKPRFGADAAQRAAAFERFAELGFPSTRDEAWKYTSLRRLESRRFAPAGEPATPALPPALAAFRIAVVDGAWHGLPGAAQAPAGLTLRTLAQAHGDGEALSMLLRVPPGGGTERFAALNAALSPDVLRVDVAERATPDPIAIDVVTTGTGPGMSHPRIVLRAAAGSIARVILRYSDDTAAESLVNSFVDVEVGARAVLHVYRLLARGDRAFHIERFEATIGHGGSFVMHDAQLGAGLARLDLNARLAAPGASAELTGLFLADGARHFDTHVHVDHFAPDTRSLQDYRGVAAGRGRAVFSGKAVVHPDAQKSEARQSSRNLLLSPGAEIDTKPELEIYADDVKCSHGATTGRLDPAALFYLRSRGLSEPQARSALTRAFAGAVLARMDHEGFASLVHDELDDRLVRLVEVDE